MQSSGLGMVSIVHVASLSCDRKSERSQIVSVPGGTSKAAWYVALPVSIARRAMLPRI
jgi:hypothetical protein